MSEFLENRKIILVFKTALLFSTILRKVAMLCLLVDFSFHYGNPYFVNKASKQCKGLLILTSIRGEEPYPVYLETHQAVQFCL